MTASVTVLVLSLEMLHCKGVHWSGGALGEEGGGQEQEEKSDLV